MVPVCPVTVWFLYGSCLRALTVCPVTWAVELTRAFKTGRKSEQSSRHLEVFLLQAAKALFVIALALVCIAEDAVGCGHLSEFFGCCLRLRALILVWVVSQRKLAICATTSACRSVHM